MKFPIVLPLAGVVGFLAWPNLLQSRIEGVGSGLGEVLWFFFGAILVLSLLAGVLLFPFALFLKKLINFRRMGTIAALLIAVPVYFFCINREAKLVVFAQQEENKQRAEPIIRAVIAYKEATKTYPPDLDVLVHEKYLETLPKYKLGTAEYRYIYWRWDDGSGIDKPFLKFAAGHVGYFFYFPLGPWKESSL